VTLLDSTEKFRRARSAYRHSRDWLSRHRWLAVALILSGIALKVFGELADELMEGTLLPIDRLILALIEPYRTELLGQIALGLSDLIYLPWVLIVAAPFVVFLVHTKRRRTLKAVVGVPLGTLGLMVLTKLIFQRDRPMSALIEEIGYSFPSGHAMGAIVFYGMLGYVAWRFMTHRYWVRVAVIVITSLLVLGTGLARIYLHVHYPSDVLAGWAAGAFILLGTLIALETWPGGSSGASPVADGDTNDGSDRPDRVD
jgi:undecaprenyl-diphosphatase